MRLIDAEPLEKKLNDEYDELFNAYGIEALDEFTDGIRTATHCDLGYIKAAPTVEAIPIEWLEEFGVTRYQKNLISNIIGTWREEKSNE